MSIFKTKSGWVELVGTTWRDGQHPQASGGVARLTVHDDVTNAVYKFTGTRADAAAEIGRRFVGSRERIAMLYGSHIEVESVPDGFWRGKGKPNEDGQFDEFEPNLERFSNVVAY